MNIELILHTKPLMLNNSQKSTKSGRRYKTTESRKWEKQAHELVSCHKNQLNMLRDTFDPSKHMLRMVMTVHMQKEKLITKKNQISKVSGDWDGMPKHLQDIIFAHFNKKLDDAFVFDGRVIKLPSIEDKVIVELSVINMRDVPEYKWALN